MGIIGPKVFDLLSGSKGTKTQATFKAWVTQIYQYKQHYKYFPPFLLEDAEGIPADLSDDERLRCDSVEIEHDIGLCVFSEAQQSELYPVTLRRLYCEHVHNVIGEGSLGTVRSAFYNLLPWIMYSAKCVKATGPRHEKLVIGYSLC